MAATMLSSLPGEMKTWVVEGEGHWWAGWEDAVHLEGVGEGEGGWAAREVVVVGQEEEEQRARPESV